LYARNPLLVHAWLPNISQNSKPGSIAWPQKEKIGCHMYQITQREPPEEQVLMPD
jgi:hypothetical protein